MTFSVLAFDTVSMLFSLKYGVRNFTNHQTSIYMFWKRDSIWTWQFSHCEFRHCCFLTTKTFSNSWPKIFLDTTQLGAITEFMKVKEVLYFGPSTLQLPTSFVEKCLTLTYSLSLLLYDSLAMGPLLAGLTVYQKEQFDWAFEMPSFNISPEPFQIERRGNVTADLYRPIKSALSVVSWACQKDNCPFTDGLFTVSARIWRCILAFNIQRRAHTHIHTLSSSEQNLEAAIKIMFVSDITYASSKGTNWLS